MVSERELLDRYALVGGPDEMIPRLRRVAKTLAENVAVREEYEREAYALFERIPGENIEQWQELIPNTRIARSIDLYERGERPCDGCAWVRVSKDGHVLWRK